MDCEYWKEIVSKLKILNECNWASHVLASDVENLTESLKCVSEEEIIENTIFAYNDWSAYPYCREILLYFEKQKVLEVYKQIENPSENMSLGFADILEDFEDGLSNNTGN